MNNSLRILLVTNSLAKGGKEKQIIQLLEFLSKNTEFLFAICLRENVIDFDIEALRTVIFYSPVKRLNFIGFANFLNKVLREFKPKIIHNWEDGVAFACTIICALNFRKINIIDGTIRHSRSFSLKTRDFWISKINQLYATKVVANSFAGLRSMGYESKGKYLVIPNSIDFKKFDNYYANNNKVNDLIRIGMVANFTKPKDYVSLVEAAILLLKNNYNIKIILVGDGIEKPGIERLIPLELKSRFIFPGLVNDPESYIVTFDIGVLLSKHGHSEGMSNSVMEYMTSGLPVICTNTGGNPELIKDGYNGYLIDYENVNMLFDRLSSLCDEVILRVKMGVRSKQIALENFDISKNAVKYQLLYNSILSS